ncbi:hypothetical protein D9615_010234 [Tricholomella constricta]|uniref:DUF3533 domain-containing protein n=1 Tax=Tricholomella constricta TaxID=117010 RepID=A0A8H5GRV6_9AGAR|nr:hypothetical protein D9615_010234 [Tricholomella constricta]
MSDSHSPPPHRRPFSTRFFDKDNAPARRIYLKALIGGCCLIIISIFAVFPIYWGALWKTPERNLNGWVVDFDGGIIGQAVVRNLTADSSLSKVTFTAVSASQFPRGPAELENSLLEQRTWVAVAINPGASDRLQASYSTPNATYDGADAITVFAAEARNENAYRTLIRPSVDESFETISTTFALQAVMQLASTSPDLTALIATSPQTVIKPISFTMDNVAPFNEPVASAVTFVGLIYVLILSFFVVMIAYGARDAAGLNRSLTLRSLILTRFATAFIAYFIVSLFYSLLTLAFQLDFTRKFGKAGFVVFWMLNWVGMLSVGLALEALITLFTARFIPFFMIIWIIVNVSVCLQPIEVLPVVYRYGYAVPFYNVSHAVRCIVFGTKNQVAMNFGILIAWAAISCLTLPLIQWAVRRRDVVAEQQQQQRAASSSSAAGAGAGAGEKSVENGSSEGTVTAVA